MRRLDQELRRAAARRVARVPGLRRVRDARAAGVVFCPECGTQLGDEAALDGAPTGARQLEFACRPGDRGPRFSRLEESPDTAGQDAGASQAAKADGKWNRKQTASGVSGDAGGKGETVG